MKTMNELVFFESEIEDSDKRLAGRIFFELMLTEPPCYEVSRLFSFSLKSRIISVICLIMGIYLWV